MLGGANFSILVAGLKRKVFLFITGQTVGEDSFLVSSYTKYRPVLIVITGKLVLPCYPFRSLDMSLIFIRFYFPPFFYFLLCPVDDDFDGGRRNRS